MIKQNVSQLLEHQVTKDECTNAMKMLRDELVYQKMASDIVQEDQMNIITEFEETITNKKTELEHEINYAKDKRGRIQVVLDELNELVREVKELYSVEERNQASRAESYAKFIQDQARIEKEQARFERDKARIEKDRQKKEQEQHEFEQSEAIRKQKILQSVCDLIKKETKKGKSLRNNSKLIVTEEKGCENISNLLGSEKKKEMGLEKKSNLIGTEKKQEIGLENKTNLIGTSKRLEIGLETKNNLITREEIGLENKTNLIGTSKRLEIGLETKSNLITREEIGLENESNLIGTEKKQEIGLENKSNLIATQEIGIGNNIPQNMVDNSQFNEEQVKKDRDLSQLKSAFNTVMNQIVSKNKQKFVSNPDKMLNNLLEIQKRETQLRKYDSVINKLCTIISRDE